LVLLLAIASAIAGTGVSLAGTSEQGWFSVFSRSSHASDRLPAQLAAGIGVANEQRPSNLSDDLYEGEWQTAGSRLLLDGLGSKRMSLYALPTTKGKACFVVRGAGGACASPNEPISWGMLVPPEGVAGNPIIAGLARDDVARIDLLVNGAREPATLGSNGFFYEAHDGLFPSAIVITFENGSSSTVEVRDPRP
jgi:hypothetical protein